MEASWVRTWARIWRLCCKTTSPSELALLVKRISFWGAVNNLSCISWLVEKKARYVGILVILNRCLLRTCSNTCSPVSMRIGRFRVLGSQDSLAQWASVRDPYRQKYFIAKLYLRCTLTASATAQLRWPCWKKMRKDVFLASASQSCLSVFFLSHVLLFCGLKAVSQGLSSVRSTVLLGTGRLVLLCAELADSSYGWWKLLR